MTTSDGRRQAERPVLLSRGSGPDAPPSSRALSPPIAIVACGCAGAACNCSCSQADPIDGGELIYAVYQAADSAPTYRSGPARRKRNRDRFVEEDVCDDMLLWNVANGEKAAMHIVFARHRAAVSRFIQRMVGNPAIADDLVGQVFLDVWRSAGRFGSCARVATWRLMIARLKAISAVPGRTHQHVARCGAAETAGALDTPATAIDGKQAHGIPQGCLDDLSSAHREIINLVYSRRKSLGELSRIVGIPDAAVRSRLFYARKQLAGILVRAGFEAAAEPENMQIRAARPPRRPHRHRKIRPAASLNPKAHSSVIFLEGEHVMKALALSALILVGSLSSIHAATPGAAFDGSWNLEFVTKAGTCDPTYEFTVDISNGVVTHPNLVRFRGYVQRSGYVRASVTVQDKYASGSGRLSGSSGKGSWTGRSGHSRCLGYWTARKN